MIYRNARAALNANGSRQIEGYSSPHWNNPVQRLGEPRTTGV